MIFRVAGYQLWKRCILGLKMGAVKRLCHRKASMTLGTALHCGRRLMGGS